MVEAAIGLGGIALGALLTWAASQYGARKEAEREHERWIRDQRFAACVEMTTAATTYTTAARRLEGLLRSDHLPVSTVDEGLRALEPQVDQAMNDAQQAYSQLRLLGAQRVHLAAEHLYTCLDAMVDPHLSIDERVRRGVEADDALVDFRLAAYQTLNIPED